MATHQAMIRAAQVSLVQNQSLASAVLARLDSIEAKLSRVDAIESQVTAMRRDLRETVDRLRTDIFEVCSRPPDLQGVDELCDEVKQLIDASSTKPCSPLLAAIADSGLMMLNKIGIRMAGKFPVFHLRRLPKAGAKFSFVLLGQWSVSYGSVLPLTRGDLASILVDYAEGSGPADEVILTVVALGGVKYELGIVGNSGPPIHLKFTTSMAHTMDELGESPKDPQGMEQLRTLVKGKRSTPEAWQTTRPRRTSAQRR
jgi:hypothetical protein